MVKFSAANTKLKKLYNVESLQKWQIAERWLDNIAFFLVILSKIVAIRLWASCAVVFSAGAALRRARRVLVWLFALLVTMVSLQWGIFFATAAIRGGAAFVSPSMFNYAEYNCMCDSWGAFALSVALSAVLFRLIRAYVRQGRASAPRMRELRWLSVGAGVAAVSFFFRGLIDLLEAKSQTFLEWAMSPSVQPIFLPSFFILAECVPQLAVLVPLAQIHRTVKERRREFL